MGSIRNVIKNFIGMEDLIQGKGSIDQTRNASTVTMHRIDVPFAVDTELEMQNLDVERYTRARVYSATDTFISYIYDDAAIAGIASNTGSGFWVESQYSVVSTGSITPRSLQDRFADVVNVKDFGAVGDGVTDDTAAFVAANTLATTKRYPIKADTGSYLVDPLVLTTSLIGDGIGRTNFIFDCSGGAVDGITFNWDATNQTEYKCESLTIKCKDGNGGKAITNQKGAYFTLANKIIIKDVAVQDLAGPNQAVTGFLTTYAWLEGVNIGDVQGAKIDNLFVYANYDVSLVDASSDVSVGLTLAGTETGLFIECTALWINACRIGIVLGDNSFGFISNSDVTFSYDGVIATTASNFNEVFISHVAVNAQRTGFYFDGIVRLFLTDTFANRHSSGIEQGNTWYGYRFETVTKSFVSNAHAQPNVTVASPQIGYYFLTCGDTHAAELISANVDTGLLIDNSSALHCSITHADTTGIILNMINNARILDIRVAASESFGGTFYTDDGSLDIRNINVKAINSTQNSTAGPSRFVETITISDKDNIGAVDEGILFLSQDGDLRVQALNSGVATNVILVDVAAGVSSLIDFRTAAIVNNNGPSWTTGTGSPEGVQTAIVGSFYSRTDGGAGTSFYVKESGVGNTGWVAK